MMMKGNWHLLAFSAFFAAMALKSNYLILWIVVLFIWLSFLYMTKRIRFLLVIMTLTSFGCFYSYFPSYDSDDSTRQEQVQKEVVLQGTIVSSVRQNDKQLSFTFRLEETKEKVSVHYFHQADSFDPLASPFPYTFRAKCFIKGKIDQANAATNPFEFDYRQYLFEKGITQQIILDSLDNLQCKQNHSPLSKLYLVRDALILQSEKQLDPTIAAWQQALIFGDSDQLSDEVVLLFQRWGLSHLLAISGLHVGIIIALLYFILIRLLGVTREKAALIVLLFLPVYALLAGGQPSVWRASLMTVFVILLARKQIKTSRLDMLSIVFLLLLIIDKYMIYHVGFQFSFAVTLGLILSAKWFSTAKSNIETILQISFIAQMMIVPLQMYYFYHFQPLSILLNVIIVPYFSLFVIPSMFFSFILYILPLPLKQLFEKLFLLVHETVLSFIIFIDRYMNFPFTSGEITLFFAIIYYFLLLMMMIHLERKKLKSAFHYGAILCLLLTFVIAHPYLSKEGRVTMLDIGQGDAFIIELPYRKGIFMIDAGASFDFESYEAKDTVYKRVVQTYLMGRGIDTIDAILISHPHLDHHGTVRFILEDFQVKEVVINEFFGADDKELQAWQEHADLKIVEAKAGDKIERKGQSFYILAPLDDKNDKNDNSLVVYARIGNVNWLFTGDISKDIEENIIDSFPELQVDILKVAHHGSNTSTSERMLEKLNPKIALLPVGRKNRYGHPGKEVIESLNQHGAKVYRTDENGAVEYRFRDDKGVIKPYIEK
ncbi:MAG TPA: DNA internalization-related competence protein ComEC/Rec2 [Pseudogracilibacillus sp.]|nr:DNA internalization-related competence protein ComEC/Rec2 [Pseudogracilibacillus sp.]